VTRLWDKGEPLDRRALFFTTGQYQRSDLLMRLGCEFNDKGTVRTGKYETTHLPGLFVAGDASRAVQWVVVAASEGAAMQERRVCGSASSGRLASRCSHWQPAAHKG